jgi:hypothetical protein
MKGMPDDEQKKKKKTLIVARSKERDNPNFRRLTRLTVAETSIVHYS